MPTKNRNWVWFFGTLVVLGLVGAAIPIWYNLHQQLTIEALESARDLWRKNGPQNYDLTIEKKFAAAASTGRPTTDTLTIQVRDGKVIWATINGQPLEGRLWREYDMEGWFDYVERFLQIDQKVDAPRTFAVGRFDPYTGALLKYTRRVTGTNEQQNL